MKITRVCCQGCGANLDVDERVNFVTCNYCHARLEVLHDPSVTQTRILQTLEKSSERMTGNLQVIELQNELERMDREWQERRAGFGLAATDAVPTAGQETVSNVASVVLVMFGVVFTLVGVVFTLIFPLFIFLPIFGVLWTCLAIYIVSNGKKKLASFRAANAEFRGQREALLRRIEELRRG